MTSTPQGAAAPAVNSLWRHRVSGTCPHTVVLVTESPSEVITRSPGGMTSTTPVDAFHDRFEPLEAADGYRVFGHATEGLGVLREVQVERDRVIASVVFPRAMGQSLAALCSLKRPVQITVPLSGGEPRPVALPPDLRDAFHKVAAALFPEDVDQLMTNTPLGDAVDALVGRVKQLRRGDQESVKASMKIAERSRQIARSLGVSEAMPWKELVEHVAERDRLAQRLEDVESARDEAFRMRDAVVVNHQAALDEQDARTHALADAVWVARSLPWPEVLRAVVDLRNEERAANAREQRAAVERDQARQERDHARAQLDAQLLTVDQTISLAYALGCERVGTSRLGDTMIAVATALKKDAEEHARVNSAKSELGAALGIDDAGHTWDGLLDRVRGLAEKKAAPPGRFATPSHVLLEERLATVETLEKLEERLNGIEDVCRCRDDERAESIGEVAARLAKLERAVIFDGLGVRVTHLLDEMDEWIARAGEAERLVDAARRRLDCVAESMTEHAYQELASALDAPPRPR